MEKSYFNYEELRKASMMVRKYFALYEAEPENELLKYCEYRGVDDFYVIESLWNEFCSKFSNGFVPIKGTDISAIEHNKKGVMLILKNYENALEKELMKFDKKILEDWGIEK